MLISIGVDHVGDFYVVHIQGDNLLYSIRSARSEKGLCGQYSSSLQQAGESKILEIENDAMRKGTEVMPRWKLAAASKAKPRVFRWLSLPLRLSRIRCVVVVISFHFAIRSMRLSPFEGFPDPSLLASA
jgi:hypothetical protein